MPYHNFSIYIVQHLIYVHKLNVILKDLVTFLEIGYIAAS